MAAHQAPLSLGFSRQEHWSGLPFPSPMHESEKWKGSCSVVSDSSRPHGLQPAWLLLPWDFPGKSTGVGAIAFSVPAHNHVSKWNRWRINNFMWLFLYSFWVSHCLSSQLFKNFLVVVTQYYNLILQLETKSHVREFLGGLVVRTSCFH